MLQLTVVKAKRLEWRDVREPTLVASTDAIVRPFIGPLRRRRDVLQHDFERPLRAAAAMHIADAAFRTARTNPFAPPFAYGHECVAEVTACGDSVRDFAAGDLVIVPWAFSCGGCSACKAGLTSKCTAARGDRPLAAFGFGTDSRMPFAQPRPRGLVVRLSARL